MTAQTQTRIKTMATRTRPFGKGAGRITISVRVLSARTCLTPYYRQMRKVISLCLKSKRDLLNHLRSWSVGFPLPGFLRTPLKTLALKSFQASPMKWLTHSPQLESGLRSSSSSQSALTLTLMLPVLQILRTCWSIRVSISSTRPSSTTECTSDRSIPQSTPSIFTSRISPSWSPRSRVQCKRHWHPHTIPRSIWQLISLCSQPSRTIRWRS